MDIVGISTVVLFVFVAREGCRFTRPRPFLNKLSNTLVSSKFCELHNTVRAFTAVANRKGYKEAYINSEKSTINFFIW